MTPQSFSSWIPNPLEGAVVFDLDDTLYLERDFVLSGFVAVGEYCRAELGLDGFAQRAAESFAAGNRGRIFDGVLASYGMAPDWSTIAALVARYRDHVPSIRLLDDARQCLQTLHGHIPLALITDGPSRTQWNKIRALGIEELFQVIVVTGDLGEEFMKPHLRAFETVEAGLGKHGAQLVYVADNPLKDFQAPRQLGWRTVRVRRVEGIYAACPTGEAVDHEVQSL